MDVDDGNDSLVYGTLPLLSVGRHLSGDEPCVFWTAVLHLLFAVCMKMRAKELDYCIRGEG